MLKIGKQKEKEFAAFFSNVSESTRDQDINEHWDLNVRYDVKMLRRKTRGGDFDENIHWVELKNVHGNTGWLYGKADYFSFEIEDYWISVSKDDLQDMITRKCKDKRWSGVPELYKLYSRKGRKDIITLVKTIDLMYISSSIIKK
jgi:hypothetical protein